MPFRANWKGFLKLSLVSSSIELYPATSSKKRIRFNIINREAGDRVWYRQTDAESGEDVPEEDRIVGYNAADGSFVLLEPAELDAAPSKAGTVTPHGCTPFNPFGTRQRERKNAFAASRWKLRGTFHPGEILTRRQGQARARELIQSGS